MTIDDTLDLGLLRRWQRTGMSTGHLAEARPQTRSPLRRCCVAQAEPCSDRSMGNYVALPADQLTLLVGQWIQKRTGQPLERGRQSAGHAGRSLSARSDGVLRDERSH